MRVYVQVYVLTCIRQIVKIGNIPIGVYMLTERVDAEPLNILLLA